MASRPSRISKKTPDKEAALSRIKGRHAKKPLVSRYVDDEAEESDGELSGTIGSVDMEDVDQEDLDSTPPPEVKSVNRPAKRKAKGSNKSSSKKVVEQNGSSSSEENMEAMAEDDSMFAAPSSIDASFVTTLITDLFKRHGTPDVLSQGPATSTVHETRRVRVSSPTPDVDDPIDYEAAEMAQAIADSVASANAVRSNMPGLGTSGEKEIGAQAQFSKGKGKMPDVVEGDNETTAQVIEYAMASSDPVTIAAGAAYYEKISAPHILAIRQAMDIKDHMERPLHRSPNSPALPPNADSLQAVLGGSSGSGVPDTMGQFMGIKSAAYAEAPVSLGVVLSDLETYKAKYNPETPCGVSDPELQDKVLRQTYLGLPPLPAGKQLLPSFVQQTDTFNYLLSGGHVEFSLWGGHIPNMNFHNSVGSVLFVDAPVVFINPSRIDPRRITSQATSTDLSRYLLLVDGKTAICVSSVMSSESVLSSGRSFGRSRPHKWLSGLLHNQEYERFVSLMCLAFGASTMYAQLVNAAVTFQTALGPLPGGGTGNDITKTGVVSPQKGFVSSSAARTSLAFEDEVPVFDGRNNRINFKTDLGRLSSVLPKFDGEIPFGSFVTVGYTATMWSAVPAVSATDKTKRPHLGCNIMWAIVVGVP
ncbi:hypothetical protein B0H11DRAFT_2223394 [Mycena galericulata]|nr:hypothetical protein B0H11DRAFT_2223394 [Mycena galericulata]